MKIAKLLAVLSFTLAFNAVHAADEMAADSENIAAYCGEQTGLAGLETVNEKQQYLQECIDSFGVQEAEELPVNQ